MGLRDYMVPRWIWELPDADRERALWEHWQDSGRPLPEGRIPWRPVDALDGPTPEELARIHSLPLPPVRMAVPKGAAMLTPPPSADPDVREAESAVGDLLERFGSWVLYEAMVRKFQGETVEFREALMQRMWNASEERKYEREAARKAAASVYLLAYEGGNDGR